METSPYNPYRAAQWLQIPVLLDLQEMETFLAVFPSLHFYEVGVVRPQGKEYLTREEFIHSYTAYVSALKKGEMPDTASYKAAFSCALSCSDDPFVVLNLSEERTLLRVQRPVIQLQEHRVDFSLDDQEFRSKVLGTKSILWGVMFSYPQLFENPVTRQPEKVLVGEEFPNTGLFREMQRWVRSHTMATPFMVDGKRKNVPIRLGKKCFSWINNHPQLRQQGLTVMVKDETI
jgi:hypothetical protein